MCRPAPRPIVSLEISNIQTVFSDFPHVERRVGNFSHDGFSL